MDADIQQYLNQAKQAEQQNQWLQAIDRYKKILEVSPDHQTAKEALAWCFSRAKEYDQAISVLQDLMQYQPKVAKWPYMIGYQYHEMEKWRESIEWYERALALNPDYIVVLYRKGYAHTRLIQVGGVPQMSKALMAFEKCRKLWHALPEGQQKQQDKGNCAKAAYHQAKVLLDHTDKLRPGEIESTISLLKEAVQLDPDDHNKHYLLGKACLTIGQSEQALSALQEADHLESNQDYVLEKWAEALIQLDRLGEALKLYERIPPHRRKGYILQSLGSLHHRMGNYKQGVETLQLAVQKDARNHNCHYHLGLCYRDAGELNLAKRELQEAIRLKQKYWGKPFHEAEKALDELQAQHPELTVELPKNGRQHGTIIKYVESRGFGFIESSAGTQIFFHIKDCRGCERIERGIRVEFEEEMSDKGPKAVRVTYAGITKKI